MRKGIVLLGFLMVFAVAGSATAGPITVDGPWYEFGVGGVGSAGGDCSACSPTVPASVTAGNAPWTFSGPAFLTVLDLFLSGDRFEVFDNLVSLGLTSAPVQGDDCSGNIGCALADPDFSRLVIGLGAGAHSITISTVASPFGGGAAVFQVRTPEPTSMLLLGSGLAGVAARIRRRRKAAKA